MSEAKRPIPEPDWESLPESVKSWIHDLETYADPAGTLRENVFLKETVKAKETLVKELETSLETSRAYVTFIHEECRRTAREAGAQIVDTTHAGDANVAAREAIRKLRGRRT